jgi:hypothetical protein
LRRLEALGLVLAAVLVACGSFTAATPPEGSLDGGADASVADGTVVTLDASDDRGSRGQDVLVPSGKIACGNSMCAVCCAGGSTAPNCAGPDGNCGKRTKITCTKEADCPPDQECVGIGFGSDSDISEFACRFSDGSRRTTTCVGGTTNTCPADDCVPVANCGSLVVKVCDLDERDFECTQ